MVLESLHAAFIFGLLLRKAVRSGLRAFSAFHRCSEPLRSKVGGASKPSPDIVRDGTALLQLASGLRHILRDGTALLKVDRIIEVLVSWLFADNLQISC